MRRFFYLVILLLCTTSLFAQRRGNPALAGNSTLQLQFDTMLDVSNRYQEFKVVRQLYLEEFMNNVNDSISGYTQRISQLEGEKAVLQSQIDATSSEVGDRDAAIADLKAERDSVSLLGMQLDKGTYSLIMWSLVIGLLIALLVALGSTRVAARNNSELKRERDKLAEELDQSRKSRLTVEQELRRQLQDEINKRL